MPGMKMGRRQTGKVVTSEEKKMAARRGFGGGVASIKGMCREHREQLRQLSPAHADARHWDGGSWLWVGGSHWEQQGAGRETDGVMKETSETTSFITRPGVGILSWTDQAACGAFMVALIVWPSAWQRVTAAMAW
ncbi:unnamed protein product [Closterium sp. NIES-54]